MDSVIDFHSHAFPDSLAPRAMERLLGEAPDVRAHLDGTVGSLLESMDANGIGRSVILNIATKPSQFEPILAWCGEIAGDRIVPFPSIHPDDPAACGRLRLIAAQGFKGVKLHPYYQDFVFDDERMFPLYEIMERVGLILLSHTGFDIAFPRERIADPPRIAAVHRRFPGLKLVASHMGAWEDWDAVEECLLGEEIYIDISYSLHLLPPERAKDLILGHRRGYVLFGTDSPWEDQGAALELFRGLELDPDTEEEILRRNAEALLGLYS